MAQPHGRLSHGDQLTMLGYLIMADWIASNAIEFPGISDPDAVSVTNARKRATAGWEALDMRSGWQLDADDGSELIQKNHGYTPRALQWWAQVAAREMPAPGVMLVEASMGEGKTEAALAAAEILARRFSLRGMYTALPTQATADAMFSRHNSWRKKVVPGSVIALLHGKRLFNKDWQQLTSKVQVQHIDEYGLEDDLYASKDVIGYADVIQWLLGKHRGLLNAMGIGTIDQLLMAGTRVSHVMLRHAGLASKVVVIDEAHSFSTYMNEFFFTVLRWLGQSGTPVVILTATLPPIIRERIIHAYLGLSVDDAVPQLPTVGYPGILTVSPSTSFSVDVSEPYLEPIIRAYSAESGTEIPPSGISVREGQQIQVEYLPDDELVARLETELGDGGCVLVIRNTVGRAQETYASLVGAFGVENVSLLHSRFTAADRAERTEHELKLFGSGGDRPHRHILVATQVAEQSFDIDADLLVTDLAPMDLLLQRIGRLHRHAQPKPRPAGMAQPRVLVTGWQHSGADEPPTFDGGSQSIYGAHLLIRTAALVLNAIDGNGWTLPQEIPVLVAAVYGDEEIVPESWRQVATEYAVEDATKQANLSSKAASYLLQLPRAKEPSLAGLQTEIRGDDESRSAIVRDDEMGLEVLLIQQDVDGDCYTLSGHRLTNQGALIADQEEVIAEAVGSLARLPNNLSKQVEVRRETVWESNPFLRWAIPVVVDDSGNLLLKEGSRAARYDPQLGLIDTRKGPQS